MYVCTCVINCSHLKDPTVGVDFHHALCLTSKKLTELILVLLYVRACVCVGGGGGGPREWREHECV